MANYKISSVSIEIRPGVVLTAEISSPADLNELLNDLEKEGLKIAPPQQRERQDQNRDERNILQDNPIGRIETRASLSQGKLAAAKLLAFKDGNPQLLRPSAFSSVSDATLCLLYAVEIGLEKSSIAYDDFKDLYDSQNIKSGSALPLQLSNLRIAGYIDKKAYTTDRTIRLTAKGATKAEEVIKSLSDSAK